MPSDAQDQEASDDQRSSRASAQSPRRRQAVAVRCVGVAGCAFVGRTVDVSRAARSSRSRTRLPALDERGELIAFAARVAPCSRRASGSFFGDARCRPAAWSCASRPARAARRTAGRMQVRRPARRPRLRAPGPRQRGDETKQPPPPCARTARTRRQPPGPGPRATRPTRSSRRTSIREAVRSRLAPPRPSLATGSQGPVPGRVSHLAKGSRADVAHAQGMERGWMERRV